jgi:DNA gyrase/topoisomerase IV subunit B
VSDERFEFGDVVLALLENALTEAQGRGAGSAPKIEVELGDDAVRVRDDGRGLPVQPHPQSGRSLVEVILTGPRRGPRNTLAQVNASCLWVEVVVHQDGSEWFQRYDMARPAGLLHRRGPSERTGTEITCAPALGERPSFEQLRDYVRSLAGDELAQQVQVHLRDLREERGETIVLGASG